ncbi:MAG: T9SS type A sorting domain-containing protein [Crocinitomicaceae bacterium]|nr:T9SS type A sorting domain-containing protein [Crocinitomicaceae bacterium]MDG1776132.1 T9SS type A sorting domain-containing protein [Crocinitomicaceae bacterium]
MFISEIKRTILIILLISFTHNVKSQIFYNGTTHTAELGCNDLLYGGIHFSNDTSYPMVLQWTKLIEDTVPGSKFYMCANVECYDDVPDTGSNSTYPVMPGDSGFLYMHYWSGEVSGTSIVKLYVYEASNPSFGDTLTYLMNIDCSAGISNIEAIDNSISVYPNPSKGLISISLKDVSDVSVTLLNNLGQILLTEKHNGTNKIDMKLDAVPGVYFVHIEAYGEIFIKKVVKE